MHSSTVTKLDTFLCPLLRDSSGVPEELSRRHPPADQEVCRDEVILQLKPLVVEPPIVQHPRAFELARPEDASLSVARPRAFLQMGSEPVPHDPLPDVQEPLNASRLQPV